jgi:hypothetical protein
MAPLFRVANRTNRFLGSDGQTGNFAYFSCPTMAGIEHRHAAVGFFPLLTDYPT